MAALLTTEKGDTDKLVKYIGECREMAIAVLPPDVNVSGLGFYLTGHPLNEHQDLLREFASHTTAMLQEIEGKTDVVLGGLVVGLRKRKTKKGEAWASFLLEDLEGTCEVLVFPRVYGEAQA